MENSETEVFFSEVSQFNHSSMQGASEVLSQKTSSCTKPFPFTPTNHGNIIQKWVCPITSCHPYFLGMIIRQLQRDWRMAISRSKPPVFKRYLLRKGRVTWSSNAESELWNHSCNSSNKNNATPLLPPFNRHRVSPDFTCFAVRGLAFMVMLFWNDQRGWRRQSKMTQAGWKNKWKERWCVFWKWRGEVVVSSLAFREDL